MKGMRFYEGKKLVSLLRNDDYAHAGGYDAIMMCMQPFLNLQNKKLLDVGCGLGKTAQIMQEMGFIISGFDIEATSIEYAKSHYNANFFTSDVIDVVQNTSDRFDIFTLYNSFYAFPDQLAALTALGKIANKDARLMLFDYTDLTGKPENNPLYHQSKTPFYPIDLLTIEATLQQAGWQLQNIIDVTTEYDKWYTQLLESLMDKKDIVIAEFGRTAFAKCLYRYAGILEAIYFDLACGAIIYANK